MIGLCIGFSFPLIPEKYQLSFNLRFNDVRVSKNRILQKICWFSNFRQKSMEYTFLIGLFAYHEINECNDYMIMIIN